MQDANSLTGILTSLVPFIAIFAIFYFLFIRPQKNQQKKHKQMLEALQVGDKVVSYGGIMCEIIKKEDNHFLVRSGESTMKLVKEYIAYKVEQ
ncbi:preprotein translocase subunit YajC [Helicobacter cholecystus]|uniref:Sec translocon accessory complex subunit YajC n=1 Tax=Helicobacter cholecystus TaxID=45498 RepID=A0A3D8IYL1_9HELI|nr:preprotein translocase subunit YajC [Helicobacter cholecystus]RDU70076.1 preprotein translocase subunit YajC [Helicobacter cholecystus]VEJ24751.1 protein export-membrane protein, YajC [Helicobacter cholecystus]